VPFHYLLTNLLVDVPGAQGAAFLDAEGEAVDFVSRGATPYELKLEGAYHGLFLRRARKLVEIAGGGGLRRLVINGSAMDVMSRALRGDYYLVVILEPGSPVNAANAAIDRVVEALDREIP
jgi:predicted regulator of Ras-like GTPase activity (Roadblock/LC7/MglB family)